MGAEIKGLTGRRCSLHPRSHSCSPRPGPHSQDPATIPSPGGAGGSPRSRQDLSPPLEAASGRPPFPPEDPHLQEPGLPLAVYLSEPRPQKGCPHGFLSCSVPGKVLFEAFSLEAPGAPTFSPVTSLPRLEREHAALVSLRYRNHRCRRARFVHSLPTHTRRLSTYCAPGLLCARPTVRLERSQGPRVSAPLGCVHPAAWQLRTVLEAVGDPLQPEAGRTHT